MSSSFNQLIKSLRAAKGDSSKLALVTFDFAVKDDLLLRDFAEAAAIPHWFDATTLGALMPEKATEATNVTKRLQALPMVEVYPAQKSGVAWNIHEATRRALRGRMLRNNFDRFLSLSLKAANNFDDRAKILNEKEDIRDESIIWFIEAAWHRLLTEPKKGAGNLEALVESFLRSHRLEHLQILAALLVELLEDQFWGPCAALLQHDNLVEWTEAQDQLAHVLWELGTRVRPELGKRLLAGSVNVCRATLSGRPREKQPQEWAVAQNNLGLTLEAQALLSDEHEGAGLLGMAADAFRASLEVRTRVQIPKGWASTQRNLANVLEEQGGRTPGVAGLKLLSQAAAAQRAALKVFTRHRSQQDWAMTKNNLGNVLQRQAFRSAGREGVKLLRQAVKVYRDALEVFTSETSPQEWAMVQSNLGNVFRQLGTRVPGNTGLKFLEKSVAGHLTALEARPRERLPQAWAMTQNNLGVACMTYGDKEQKRVRKIHLYKRAEKAFLAALEIRTKEAMPYYHLRTKANLDMLRMKLKMVQKGPALGGRSETL